MIPTNWSITFGAYPNQTIFSIYSISVDQSTHAFYITDPLIHLEGDEGVLVPESGGAAHRPPYKEDPRQHRLRRLHQDVNGTPS